MSARKFLALALAACSAKQYEEAGVFLGQAAAAEDAEEVAIELGEGTAPEAEGVEDLPVEESESECEDVAECSTSSDEEDLDWGDDAAEDEDSVSSGARRKHTSMHKIGRIMAEAMSVSSEDDEEDEEEGEDEGESDPDFVGETLVPASFSSIKVKSGI